MQIIEDGIRVWEVKEGVITNFEMIKKHRHW